MVIRGLRFSKKPGQFRLDPGRQIEGRDKGVPLYCGNGKFALVGKSVFRLKAGGFDNEMGNGGARELRAGANQGFLTIRDPQMEVFGFRRPRRVHGDNRHLSGCKYIVY